MAVDPDFVLDNMNGVIDNIFEKYVISPMKSHMRTTVNRKCEGKAKLKRAKQNFDKLNEIKLGDEIQVFSSNKTSRMNKDIAKKDGTFDETVVPIKDKMKISDKRTIAHFLTLDPESMSFQKVTKIFEMTEKQAKKSRKLYCEKGLKALPPTYKGKTLSKDVMSFSAFVITMMNFHSKCLEKRLFLVYLKMSINKKTSVKQPKRTITGN